MRSLVWNSLVHEEIGGKGEAHNRRRRLLRDFPLNRKLTAAEVPDISPDLARQYARKTEKTVQRDLNFLVKRSFLVRERGAYRINTELLFELIPRRLRKSGALPASPLR